MNRALKFLTLPSLSLYIHIPWCIKKCPYCDFNSHVAENNIPEDHYIKALLQDIENDLPYVQNRKLSSIFFGGGTPSLFSAKAIEKILNYTELKIGFEHDIEITLEANPGTFEYQKFSDFKLAGVNRLSIGIQSFDDRQLKNLGRIHKKNEAIEAARAAKHLDFNFNLDLMHGLPGQTPLQAMDDLEIAIDLLPEHISWYQLTIEPNTVFHQSPPILPQEDMLSEIQQQGVDMLSNAQFQQYEISAYAKPGKQSKHNLNYWQFGDYLGGGAGAHGKFTSLEDQAIYRTTKTRLPNHYLDRKDQYISNLHTISEEELPLEFMMNALRLFNGVPSSFYQQRTGLLLNTLNSEILTLRQKGLMTTDSQKLCCTPLGLRFLNELLGHFND